MKKIQLEYYNEFNYPVGTGPVTAIKNMNRMATEFLNFFKTEEIDEKKQLQIVCMGSSGAILATLFYQHLVNAYPKNVISIIHIKKQGENSHSSSCSGLRLSAIHIFVDDFVFSGSTIKVITDRIRSGTMTPSFTFRYLLTASCPDGVAMDLETAEYLDNNSTFVSYFEN